MITTARIPKSEFRPKGDTDIPAPFGKRTSGHDSATDCCAGAGNRQNTRLEQPSTGYHHRRETERRDNARGDFPAQLSVSAVRIACGEYQG
jgi:hypothetical protein